MRSIIFQIIIIIVALLVLTVPLTPAVVDNRYGNHKSLQPNILSSTSKEIADNKIVYNKEFFQPTESQRNLLINPSRNDYQFHGISNESIYVVKITSPTIITLVNGSIDVEQYVIGEQVATSASYVGCFFTNTTWFSTLVGFGSSEVYQEGQLRYEHYELFNFINYTYDNRSVRNISDGDQVTGGWLRCPDNVSFNPGTWYFIFTGVVYDLKQDDLSTHWNIWMNFTNEGDDLDISTYGDGKVYGLWYGEYDANVIRSKAHTSEFMFNGKARFHIENNFLFQFKTHPSQKGFWNIRWRTPEGLKKFNMIMNEDGWQYDEEKVDGCVYGLGGPGDYHLRTSYFDYDPEDGRAWPPYFVGIDVEFK